MYKIEFKASVLKDIRRIPQVFLEKIELAINGLSKNPLPKGVKKVQGYDKFYRLRVGMYRVVYSLGDKVKIITIIKIGHQKEVYRGF